MILPPFIYHSLAVHALCKVVLADGILPQLQSPRHGISQIRGVGAGVDQTRGFQVSGSRGFSALPRSRFCFVSLTACDARILLWQN